VILTEEITEKLRQQGVFIWLANAIWEIVAIFYIAALPTASYVMSQGIPLTRLFSTNLWIASIAMGIIVTLTVVSMMSLILEALALFRGVENGRLKRSKGTLAFDGAIGLIHALLAILVLTALVVFASSFGWGTRIELIVWLACALAVVYFHFKETAGERLPTGFRFRLDFLLCAMATISSSYLAPVGSGLLNTIHLGGGLPISFVVEGGPVRTGALILEVSNGWFIREDSNCPQLTFIPSDVLQQQTWFGRSVPPGCQLESNYISHPRANGA